MLAHPSTPNCSFTTVQSTRPTAKATIMNQNEDPQLNHEELNKIIAEYEATVQGTLADNDHLKRKVKELEDDKLKLVREKNIAMEDLSSVESAFSDLLRKYERCKSMLNNAKKNEDVLLRRDKEMTYKVNSAEAKVEDIKAKVSSKLEAASAEWESRFKETQTETAKLRAQLRKSEMKVEHLEKDLSQKTSEVERLSKYCDELIDRNVVH